MKQVELINATKSYDKETKVLNEIDLEIEQGEFFVLVGPSGCGKSTLLRMIAGLEEMTGGILKINGREANRLAPKDRNLSMVFQNYALYPHLSVEQNILFGLHAKKVNKEEGKRRLQEAAEMMGLTTLLKRKPRELSGGQRQRVALARAVVSEAPLCLMDEPLSNLDAKLRAHMRIEIRRLQRKLGLTMIYVTHDQIEAMTMGDRIMVLNEGHIQQVGKPIELYNTPANLFVATFIGSPKMNIGKARFVSENGQLLVEETIALPIKQPLDSNLVEPRLTIGIRSEHIRFEKEKPTVTLLVASVEQLGNETVVVFEVGKELWTAKWSGQWAITAGDLVPVAIDLAHISFFDSVTGKLLKPATTNVQQEVVAL
ncbi:glycerol-3-phosphate ABC transporter ATP-binding protein [Shouchella clausii]|uniref:ABC transporter ATP-binding protein n=1 Tax=Shouchella clausii TaxID=79880 RepID=UPI001B09C292|nr:sn-glycerol-3-phosphate ABC transporter ATP-binding protein UgpC [Shouchella clausii]GIN08497.1 glycerol-3-phosphate ABC transporter ATP-binding protein [Shouchella clausii]